MGLVNTREFWIVGVIVGVVLVIGIIYFIKTLNNKKVSIIKKGGRRKRTRLVRKKRR